SGNVTGQQFGLKLSECRRAGELILHAYPLEKPAPEITIILKQAREDYCKGDYDAALIKYSNAISRDPNLALTRIARGLVYYTKNQVDLALADCNEAIRINPNFAAGYIARASIHQKRNENDLALADLNFALRLDGNNVIAYVARGGIYYAQHHYDLALADCG